MTDSNSTTFLKKQNYVYSKKTAKIGGWSEEKEMIRLNTEDF